jgi:hypothetical protein
MINRRRWYPVQHGCVSVLSLDTLMRNSLTLFSTVAYKQAALNAIAYLMKIGYSKSCVAK